MLLGSFGFSWKFIDAVILVGDHQAEAGSLTPWHFMTATLNSAFFPCGSGGNPSNLLADLVAGQNDNIFRIIPVNEGNILIDGVGSALIPVGAGCLLVRRQHMHTTVQTVQVPRLTIAHVLVRTSGWYCVRIPTVSISELTQLDSGKSIIRYLPPNGTAGLASFWVSAYRREPWPPARIIAIISFAMIILPLFGLRVDMVRFPKEPYLMLPWVFILHAGYPPVYRVPHALGVLALVAAFLAVVLAAVFLAAGFLARFLSRSSGWRDLCIGRLCLAGPRRGHREINRGQRRQRDLDMLVKAMHRPFIAAYRRIVEVAAAVLGVIGTEQFFICTGNRHTQFVPSRKTGLKLQATRIIFPAASRRRKITTLCWLSSGTIHWKPSQL